jgi:hypothetical protein
MYATLRLRDTLWQKHATRGRNLAVVRVRVRGRIPFLVLVGVRCHSVCLLKGFIPLSHITHVLALQ